MTEDIAKIAEAFGLMLRAIQKAEWACDESVCSFPHDGNCWCFNTALDRHTQQACAAAVRQFLQENPDAG